jgi:D-lactate dehydrogenase
MALILTLNRKLHKAYGRVREGNFSLTGLLGFDMHGRTIGVIGTGMIGRVFIQIARGFGCRVLAHDVHQNPDVEKMGAHYTTLDELYAASDIVSLHCPLTPETKHLVNPSTLAKMKRGVMIINTGRGALLDTRAAIAALKSGQIGALGLDVYEEEEALFFDDHSGDIIQDDVFTRLLTFPNVLITAHQAFFTEEALTKIAETTVQNLTAFETGEGEVHLVSP